MFNLTNRIQRLLSWIKTNQEHQNSLIVQEQLGNVASREATNETNLPIENESNITTSFDISSEISNCNNTQNDRNNNSNNRSSLVNAVLMQYQSSNSTGDFSLIKNV